MHYRRLIGICLLLILLQLACNLPVSPALPTPTLPPQNDAVLLATDDPNAPPTATPFQPDHSSPTPGETLPVATLQETDTNILLTITTTATPQPAETTTTTAQPSAPSPTIESLPVPQGIVNILLLGSDLRSTDPSFRTDVILWVAVNTDQKTVSIISFPRDLWVMVPGVGMQRINASQEYGGFPLTQATFESNFGVTPDHYVLTNFSGFTNIIDILGGIDVNAAQNLTDSCDIPGYGKECSVGPGMVHMNSALALWYVRSRYSTSDIDRGRRAQEVILAIFRRLLSLGAITHAAQIYDQFHGMVETDMALGDILPLLPLITSIGDGSAIRRFSIDYHEVYDWTTADGAQVLVPYPSAIQNVLRQALYPQ